MHLSRSNKEVRQHTWLWLNLLYLLLFISLVMLKIVLYWLYQLEFASWQTTPQLSAITQETLVWAHAILFVLHWSPALTQVSAVSAIGWGLFWEASADTACFFSLWPVILDLNRFVWLFSQASSNVQVLVKCLLLVSFAQRWKNRFQVLMGGFVKLNCNDTGSERERICGHF